MEVKNEVKSQRKVLACALSAVFFYMCNNGVSVALPQITATFPQNSLISIQMMVMFPGIMTATSALAQGWLLRRFSKRHLIVAGMLLLGASAICALVFNSELWQLFLWNGLMGVGAGRLCAPVAALLLKDISTEKTYAARMGLWNASLSLGGIVISLVGGLAVQNLSWPWCYAVNAVAIPLALFCLVWLPAGTPQSPTRRVARSTHKLKSTGPAVRAFAFALPYFVALPNLPLLVQENSLGTASMAGVCVAALMLGGLAMGVLYSRLPATVRLCYGTTLGAVALGIGCMMLAFCGQNQIMLLAGAFLCGASNSLVVPTLSQEAAVYGEQYVMLTATAFPALASFVSPGVYTVLMRSTGLYTSAQRFALAGFCAFVLGGALYLWTRKGATPNK